MKGESIDREGPRLEEYRLLVTAQISLESRAYDQVCSYLFEKAGISLKDFQISKQKYDLNRICRE